jgi:hypothetical protein
MKNQFLSQSILIAIISVAIIATLFTLQSASALPAAPPPNGNPVYSDGPTGPVGDQGATGAKGQTGDKGAKGDKGALGRMGIGNCNWSGAMWVSHGFDGGCAWNVGAYWYCESGRLTRMAAHDFGYCGGWSLD